MALYFDTPLECPSGAYALCVSWNHQYELIAVGFVLPENAGGLVSSFNKQGISEQAGPLLQKSASPTALAWHPNRKFLAIGWDNGEVDIFNDQDKEVYSVPQLHTAAITTLNWTGSGSRLGTGDKEGVFAAWKVDQRGRTPHDPSYRIAFDHPVVDSISKPSSGKNGGLDTSNIADLAKAAVSGDEAALDLLANFNSASGGKLKGGQNKKESLNFYVGLNNGGVYFVNESGSHQQCFELSGSIQEVLYSPKNDYLVAVSSKLQVYCGRVADDGKVEKVQEVTFSGVEGGVKITWAGSNLLAAATSDQALRLWDLATNNNSSLLLQESHGFLTSERLTCVSFCKSQNILAALTDSNHIAIWKLSPDKKIDSEDAWSLQPAVHLDLPCSMIEWCDYSPILAVGGAEGASLLTEQKSQFSLSFGIAALQVGPKQITLAFIGEKQGPRNTLAGLQLSPSRFSNTNLQSSTNHHTFTTEITINGLSVSAQQIAVWDGRLLSVYEINQKAESLVGTFECASSICAIHENSVFSVEKLKNPKDPSRIQVHNFQGTVKQLIQLQENEGKPTIISVTADFMVYGTTQGFIRVYDLTRREAKAQCSSRELSKLIPNFGSISALRCNLKGNKVAILVLKDNGVPDSKLYVYDVELDKIESFDFFTGTNDSEDLTKDAGPKSDIEQSRADAALEVAGRYPISIRWDATDRRLLCCEAKITDAARKEMQDENGRRSASSAVSRATSVAVKVPDVMVVSLFVTLEHGLMIQDSFGLDKNFDNLIGLKTPNFYFSSFIMKNKEKTDAAVTSDDQTSGIVRKTMRDFVGLEVLDEPSQKAMLNFSYYLTIGDMDEAFKAIKLIKGIAVWESMARMCVKTRRLDVARVCLANMGHARGAKALREMEKETDRDARVARLAIELGMNEEAERLYKTSERYDLLNQFYQSTNQWQKALEIANQLDRINMRTTFYNYAKHLETAGDIANAITNYEKSGNHYFEVPRMLFDDHHLLEEYIMKTQDRKLRKWWAQYMESTGEMETALKFYNQAADPLSLVRVYCYCGNIEKATEIANETGDRAACYHLARQFENNNDFKQAIHFFSRAHAYGNAVRICKDNGFEDQLMNLALLGDPVDMVEAARYYEDRPDTVDKAVMLYHKAGYFSEALELAFNSQQYAALEVIGQELDDRTDPALLEKCANFYKDHNQAEKSVPMLVAAKKYEEAIRICYEYNVDLNENLVEKLTVPSDAMDKTLRDQLLVMLGDCLMRQAKYHLACQKYTQGGDKEQAMRALLKSGDTEKIIFFAGVSRTRNIYVMAANYLQSLDWRKDPEIMKNIISFYTKGRAQDSLAGFYAACAQVEIDEYQNYDKAHGALTEAYKCLSKAKVADQHQQEIKLTELKNRMNLVKKFIQARRLFDSNPEEGIKQCHNLLMEADLEASVRYGDVYGLLIEYYAARENYDKAFHYIQELRSRLSTMSLSYFVNVTTIEAVYRAVGQTMDPSHLGTGEGQKGDSDTDEVAEEVFGRGH